MFELSLLVVSALGIAWWRARRQGFLPSLPHLATLGRLAQGGQYQWDKPQERTPSQAISALHVIEGGLSLLGADGRVMEWLFSDVQYVGEVVFTAPHTAQTRLYIEHAGVWRVLTLSLVRGEMGALLRLLRRHLPPQRLGMARPFAPMRFRARLASQALDGQVTLGAEVGLYLLPHLLAVLRDDETHAKIALEGLRRVVALERDGGREGMVCLYGATQTAFFVLAQHETLAHALSEVAHCALEVVARNDKEK